MAGLPMVKGSPPPLRRAALSPASPEGVRGAFLSFLRAFLRAETYLPHRNLFFVFGLLWGAPIPVVTLFLDLSARDLPITVENCLHCYRTSPVHWWFLTNPFLFAVFFGAAGTVAHDRGRQIESLIRRLRILADTDALTGLYNHRVFQERVRQEAARAEREGQPISLLLADIDRFKAFNDEYGHPAGDDLLRGLAVRLRTLVRPYDIVCRYGGEEFAVILPGLGGEEAVHAAERLRAGVAQPPFEVVIARGVPTACGITLSVGVAAREPGEPVTYWIARADRHLYAAKRSGRNRVGAGEGDEPVANQG